MSKQFPVLVTERLILRRLTVDDSPVIAILRSDDVVNKYISRPSKTSVDEASSFIAKVNNGFENDENYYWVICNSTSKEFCGTICLWNFSEDGKIAEIGYELLLSHHGKGLMTEAVSAVIEFAKMELHLQALDAYTHKRNKPSIRLLKNHVFMVLKGKSDPENENNVVYRLGLE